MFRQTGEFKLQFCLTHSFSLFFFSFGVLLTMRDFGDVFPPFIVCFLIFAVVLSCLISPTNGEELVLAAEDNLGVEQSPLIAVEVSNAFDHVHVQDVEEEEEDEEDEDDGSFSSLITFEGDETVR